MKWCVLVYLQFCAYCAVFKYIKMIGFFKSLKGFLKLDSVWIDNLIFRLHYKVTVMIFVAASLMVTSKQYIGDPIDCMVDGVPSRIMDTYCWIHSTYSIPTRYALITDLLRFLLDVFAIFLHLKHKFDIVVTYHKLFQHRFKLLALYTAHGVSQMPFELV